MKCPDCDRNMTKTDFVQGEYRITKYRCINHRCHYGKYPLQERFE